MEFRKKVFIAIMSLIGIGTVVILMMTGSQPKGGRARRDIYHEPEIARSLAEQVIKDRTFHGEALVRLANEPQVILRGSGMIRLHLLDIHEGYFSVDGNRGWACDDGFAEMILSDKPMQARTLVGDWIEFRCKDPD